MKTWYADVKVKYTDKNEQPHYFGSEIYSFIIRANSKKIAETKAKLEAIEKFNEEINDGFEDIKTEVSDIYETTDDARCS